jgi:hypothetical protein
MGEGVRSGRAPVPARVLPSFLLWDNSRNSGESATLTNFID